MATQRTILNRALDLLGEDRIPDSASELSEQYHLLISAALNQFKTEIENSTNWRSLWHTETVTCSAAVVSTAIPNTTGDSQIARIQDQRYSQLVPLVYDVTDPARPVRLREYDLPELIDKQTQLGTDTADNPPSGFAVESDGEQSLLRLYPLQQSTKSIVMTLVTPQPYLLGDDLDTEILIPEAPLFAGLMWYALEERGENLGASSLFTEERYREVLGAAVARDEAARGDNDLVVV